MNFLRVYDMFFLTRKLLAFIVIVMLEGLDLKNLLEGVIWGPGNCFSRPSYIGGISPMPGGIPPIPPMPPMSPPGRPEGILILDAAMMSSILSSSAHESQTF
jgi:hypothetical protein